MIFFDRITSFLENKENQKRISILFHIVFIGIVLFTLIQTYFSKGDNPLFFFTSDAFELLTTTMISYFLYYKILFKESLKLKVVSISGALVVLFTLAELKVYRQGKSALFQMFGLKKRNSLDDFFSFVGMVFLFCLLFYFFQNLDLFFNNSITKMKKSLKEAELQLLRQRFNPHFLYNAFNSLYSMSLQKHEQTPDTILKLSSMMRYLTDDVSISKVPLARELKFISEYLDIERIRFGEHANIQFEIQGDIQGKLIEPLLLITLIENAFKHGFYTNSADAFVSIKVSVIYEKLIVHVKNSIMKKQHFQDEKRDGKGLNILRKRLDLSYPQKSDLKIKEANNIFETTIILYLN